jgi:hypothetical protein
MIDEQRKGHHKIHAHESYANDKKRPSRNTLYQNLPQQYCKAEHRIDRIEQQKTDEEFVVMKCNARVDKEAMMVHSQVAAVATRAMMRSWWFKHFANVANFASLLTLKADLLREKWIQIDKRFFFCSWLLIENIFG